MDSGCAIACGCCIPKHRNTQARLESSEVGLGQGCKAAGRVWCARAKGKVGSHPSERGEVSYPSRAAAACSSLRACSGPCALLFEAAGGPGS